MLIYAYCRGKPLYPTRNRNRRGEREAGSSSQKKKECDTIGRPKRGREAKKKKNKIKVWKKVEKMERRKRGKSPGDGFFSLSEVRRREHT